MDEKTTKYILDTLSSNKVVFNKINDFAIITDRTMVTVIKTLNKQKRINRRMALSSILFIGYIVYNEVRLSELKEKTLKGD